AGRRLRSVANANLRTPVRTFVLRVFEVHLLPVRVANVNSSVVRNLDREEDVGPSRPRHIVNRISQRLHTWSRRYTNCNNTAVAADIDSAIILVHVDTTNLSNGSDRGGGSISQPAIVRTLHVCNDRGDGAVQKIDSILSIEFHPLPVIHGHSASAATDRILSERRTAIG